MVFDNDVENTLEKTVPLADGSGKPGFRHAEKLSERLTSHTAQNSTTKEP